MFSGGIPALPNNIGSRDGLRLVIIPRVQVSQFLNFTQFAALRLAFGKSTPNAKRKPGSR